MRNVVGLTLTAMIAFMVTLGATCGANEKSPIFSFARDEKKNWIVTVRVDNPSEKPWCLAPTTFFSTQFLIDYNGEKIAARGPYVEFLRSACLRIDPGEGKQQTLNLMKAFDANDLARGKLCYMAAFEDIAAPSPPTYRLDTICEGRRKP